MKNFLYLIISTIAVVIFFAFQNQETEKFYYEFDEKIPLFEVENKFVVRYAREFDKMKSSKVIKIHSPTHPSNGTMITQLL
jgi:hypothetical protein